MEKELDIQAVIGFTGKVNEGLILHPDNEHLIYPLGSTIVVRHIISRSQTFLRGHDNQISIITVSKTGKYIASGQKTYMGFQADIIIWDFETRSLMHRLKLHKDFNVYSTMMVQFALKGYVQIVTGEDNLNTFVKEEKMLFEQLKANQCLHIIQERDQNTNRLCSLTFRNLSFCCNEQYLASLGGQDDKNMMIVWDVEQGKALYGAPNRDAVNQIKFFNNADDKIIAVLSNGVQILTIDKVNKKIKSLDVNFGNIKRQFTCVAIDPSDTHCYCGTKTGDVFEINIERAIYKRLGPVKKLFSLGIGCLGLLPNGDIIVGAGDGTIAKLSVQNMQVLSQSEILGAVTSISFTGDFTHFFCGTSQSNIYWIDSEKLNPELRNTCHYDRINDIAFPYNYSDVFATCSTTDIRVWNARNRQELLRIQVPNLECYCVTFMNDGKSIISGWNDGKIRAFLPQSGKLLYVISDAHIHGVTALSTTSDCQRIVSGGSEGEVRVWVINKQTQVMKASMKEHRGRVWSIQVKKNNDQAVSASADGSCIIWDLKTFTRLMCLFESTLFKQVLYHPEESQLLTTGSDRKITYWEIYDGQAIRMLDGSEEGEVNALSITKEGEHFVSGGEDKLVKLWGYDEGIKYFSGTGHSGAITRLQISPDQRTIVSVGSEGAIFIWRMPEEIVHARADNELPTISKEKHNNNSDNKSQHSQQHSQISGASKGSQKHH